MVAKEPMSSKDVRVNESSCGMVAPQNAASTFNLRQVFREMKKLTNDLGEPSGLSTKQFLPVPILGRKGSLKQIPVIGAIEDSAATKSSSTTPDRHEALVSNFKKLPPQCRELIRRRLYGLKKKPTVDIESEARRLPQEAFTAEARQLFVSLATSLINGGKDLLAELWLTDYAEVPPSIDQFINDDRFLGQTLRPRADNAGLWPTWSELLRTYYDLDSEINNTVLTGALGTGKTLTMVVLILYRLALVTLLRNPQSFFEINRTSRLSFLLLSVTQSTVRDTAFNEALNLMADSPYFIETCGFDPSRKYAEYRVEMERVLEDGRGCRVVLAAGSQTQHLIGRNLVAIGLDEGNFRLEAQPNQSAHQLYGSARSRMESRFGHIPDFLPTLSLIASSAADQSSFTEQVIGEINRSGRPQNQRVHRFAIYNIQKPGLVLSGNWFKVCHGLANMEPFILSGRYTENGTPVGTDLHEAPAPGACVELVPQNYLESFQRDARSALQEFSGIAVGGTHRLFSSRVDLNICIEMATNDGVKNPLVGRAETLIVSTGDAASIWESIDGSKFVTYQNGQVRPLRHPESKRYAHVDLALTSAAGLAICHLVPQSDPEALATSGPPIAFRLIVEYDLILRLVPGPQGHLSTEKIQNLFLVLRNQWGFQFGKITYDMFQSASSLEVLQARGFNSERLSIDRDKTAYAACRAAVQERRLRLYPHQRLVEELLQLVDAGRKYDHPPGGSKDVADAVVGAHLNAINSAETTTLASTNNCGVYGVNSYTQSDPSAIAFDILQGYARKHRRVVKEHILS